MLATKRLSRFYDSRYIFFNRHSFSKILNHEERCISTQSLGMRHKKFWENVFAQPAAKSNIKVAQPRPNTAQSLTPQVISTILTDFIRKPQIRNLAAERGLTGNSSSKWIKLSVIYLFIYIYLYLHLSAKQLRNVFVRFRGLCLTQSENKLPVELEFVLNDIMMGASPPDELFRQFMDFAMKMYPHLQCRDELSRICDLRDPAAWCVVWFYFSKIILEKMKRC